MALSSLSRSVLAALFLALVSATTARAADARNLLASISSDADTQDGWRYWAPRPDLAQEHAVVTRDGAKALMLRTRGFESYGFWSMRVNLIEPGKYYHFEALHQPEGIAADSGSVF